MKWRREFIGLIVLGALGALAIGGLFTYLSYERSTDVDLPVPTGPFSVGCVIRRADENSLEHYPEQERHDAIFHLTKFHSSQKFS